MSSNESSFLRLNAFLVRLNAMGLIESSFFAFNLVLTGKTGKKRFKLNGMHVKRVCYAF